MKQCRKNRHRMGRWSKLAIAGLLAFSGFAFSGTKTAFAADKNASVTIGVLDEDALSNKFTKYQEGMQAIDQRARDLDEQLKARDLLNPDEGTRFDTLIVKSDITADEQNELNGLIKTGNDRRSELLGLSGKATRTDDENARIKELQATLKSNADATQKLQDALLKNLLSQKQSTETKFADQANQAVAEVAKQKNLTLVLSKSAVVWNSPTVDITEDVVKQLEKTK